MEYAKFKTDAYGERSAFGDRSVYSARTSKESEPYRDRYNDRSAFDEIRFGYDQALHDMKNELQVLVFLIDETLCCRYKS